MQEPALVYIIDDDEAILKSLHWLIESDDIKVKAFSDAITFLEQFAPHHPSCLIADIRMPRMSGLELQDQLLAKNISIPIIFISGHANIPMAVSAINKGALDFLIKPFNDQRLLESVNSALKYDHQSHEKLELVSQFKERLATLTTRERQIYRYMITGCLNKIIAAELGIHIKTVEIHRAHIMQKTQVKSLAELVKLSILSEQ